MATVAFFHAHPDDECMLTGGTMAKLGAAGHRVVLVTATRGERGEVPEGLLAAGETLGQHRSREVQASAAALGVARAVFLGYTDSGMMGTPDNDAPDSFWQADVDAAAQRLADLLAEERADVLVTYDSNGGYGHPDHIQVHRVGVRAAEHARTPVVYEAVVDRDRVRKLVAMARAEPGGDQLPDFDVDDFGVSSDQVTTRVDVSKQPGRQASVDGLSCQPDRRYVMGVGTDPGALRQRLRRGAVHPPRAPPGTLETDLNLPDES